MELKKIIFFIFAAIAAAFTAPAQEGKPAWQAEKDDISYTDAVILGLVEGITEYLPVSSTGHLILTNAALKLDADTPVLNEGGVNIMKTPDEPYTLKSLVDSYCIVIQLGAIASVALLYWRYILMMAIGLLGRNPTGLKLFVNLIAAFVPAAVVGLAFHDAIERYLFGVLPVIIALFAGAIVMWIAQRRYDKKGNSGKLKMEDLTLSKSVMIGLLQCFALLPGTSRSMMTILGGYFAGLDEKNSAKFSFLLGLVTLSAASLYKIYKDGSAMAEALSIPPLVVGLLVAFVSSAAAVKWLISFLTRHGLVPFAIYRVILAGVLALALYSGMF